MHLAPLIADLAVILGVAGVVTLLFQKIRQPVVLGYLIAGYIIGPHSFSGSWVSDLPNIRIWAELGVIFLMFSLGLDFSFRKLAKVGISSSVTAVFEMTCMCLTGYFLARYLGWRRMDRIFLGAILAISSTTIIVKALDELKLRTRRFAEQIFGVLVVEDLAAVLILVALSTLAVSGGFSGLAILLAAGKLVLVVGSWFLVGYFVLPRFVRYVGKAGNDEMLTILSLGLCLFLAVLASKLNYSVALGAFIMGSILAESTESHRIDELVRPLRDLFAAVFFVSVGMLMEPEAVARNLGPILLITAVYLLVKITAVTLGSLLTGQTLRTSVQVGFGVAQIGEFSFIIATLGVTLGLTSDFLFPVAVSVSLITTFLTPYLIRVSHKFAVELERALPLGIRQPLGQYAVWSQERRADARRRMSFYRHLFRWFLNALFVTVVFVLVHELVLPIIREQVSSVFLANDLAWVLALLVSSPFIWAMLTAFQGFGLQKNRAGDKFEIPRGGILFLVRLLTGFWIGGLSLQFLAVRYAILLIAVFAGALFFLFRRQLETSYQWVEHTFLETFESAPKTKKHTDVLKHLAPWDAHLVRIKVHPNAEIAGKTVRTAGLRSRFGLNIVAIQRGLRTIVAPRPEEMIFPKDELLVLGTDEQIEQVRFGIEKPPGLEDRYRHTFGYELKRVVLPPSSPFVGKSIRQSGVRERYGAMVVGLERGDRRMINPDSDTELKAEDTLWVVGETEGLAELIQESSRGS